MSSKSQENPWKSINSMLIQNKCWLCEQTFRRGKKKQVFQVFQLFSYFDEMNDQGELAAPFECPNVQNCYESYCKMGGKNNIEGIVRFLQDSEIETWISGLVCCLNENCARDFNRLFATDIRVETSNFDYMSRKDCPPGCNCDNPWPFLT